VVVYSLSKSSGEVICYGWGPANKPLSPLKHIPEGMTLIRQVATGELVLQNLLGAEVSGLNAARIVGLLSGRSSCGRRGLPVAVFKRGRVRRFGSIRAAAQALGMSMPNLRWYLHFLPTVALYVAPAKPVRRKHVAVAPVAPATPVVPVEPNSKNLPIEPR
jgi:hypothetical protein